MFIFISCIKEHFVALTGSYFGRKLIETRSKCHLLINGITTPVTLSPRVEEVLTIGIFCIFPLI